MTTEQTTEQTSGNTSIETVAAPTLHEIRSQAFLKVFGDKYMERFTDPILFVDAEFFNYRILKYYENNFKFMSKNLFAEYVYRRRPKYDRAILTKFAELMDKKLDAVGKLLQKMNDQVSHVLTMHGVSPDEIGYVKSEQVLVPVIHAQARSYLELLHVADKLFTNIAAATLQGLMDTNSKTEAEQKTMLAMRNLGNVMRSETVTLRKEAQRVRSLMHAEGDQDPEMDEAMKMQDDVIEEAAMVEAANTKIDGISFTPLPGNAAADAAAASKAASTASAKAVAA